MENNRSIVLLKSIFTLVGLFLIIPFISYGYYPDTTHKGLTADIIKFFNASYPNLKINSLEEIDSIKKGSVNEDSPSLRSLNHFYDPISNRGLNIEKKAGDPNLAFVGGAPLKVQSESSKDWAQDTKAQAGVKGIFAGMATSYFGSNDDYSWDRGIYEYAWGNKQRGLESLGHVLHLIEDASVPDHTRNDMHAGHNLPFGLTGISPYEDWTNNQFNENTIKVFSQLQEGDAIPIVCGSLNNCFNLIAQYSNNNFFSKDTIFAKEYSKPTVFEKKFEKLSDGQIYEFGYQTINHEKYKLVLLGERLFGSLIQEPSIDDPDKLILSSYWSLLSKQAVLHGAGVVKLFFDEVEKERRTKILYNKNRSWIGRSYDGVRQAVFGTASVLYGSSVTEKDVSENNSAEISPSSSVEPSSSQSPAVSPRTTPVHTREGTTPVHTEVSPSPTHGPLQIIMSTPTPQRSIKVVSQLPFPTPSIFNTGERGGGESGGSQSSSQSSENKTVISPTPEATASSSSLSPSSSPTPTTTPIIVSDTQAPSVSFAIKECTVSLSPDGCLIATSTMTLAWSSSDTDVAHYKIECTTNGVACDNFSFASSTATSTIYRAPADTMTYVFKATAVDTSGNESPVQTASVDVSLRPIVINEIAWAGTGSSPAASKDEWIELYNPTSKNISLANMLVNSPSNSSFKINLSGTIAPHGYYLIERTDDNVITDIPADLTATFGSGLSNSGEQLVLNIGSTTIDATPPAGTCHDGWCAGSASGQYYTMERYDPLSSGEDRNNWGSWQDIVSYGTNAEKQAIHGTPKHRNSINYLLAHLSTTVPLSKTITKANSPYVVASQMTLAPDAILTIEPGVVIKFKGAGSSLSGSGVIIAKGTESDPIIFTSFNDDSYAGDTNQNGTTSSPHAGDWGSVRLVKDGSKIDWAIVSYGGGDDKRSNVYVKDTSADITHSIIQESKFYGMFLEHASGSLTNNTIQNNSYQQNSESTGLYAFDGDLVIRGNMFSGNIVGAQFVSGGNAHSFQVENNNFINNKQEAVSVSTTYPRFSGNTATGNGINGTVLRGNVTEDYSLTPDLPYVVEAYAVVSGKTLTLMPGVVIKFQQGGGMSVLGALQAKGTEDHPVVFTSFYDDDCGIAGGCTDTDNGSTTPHAGDWFTMRFASGSGLSLLDYVKVRYGGKSMYYSHPGALQINAGALLDVAHTTIEKNYYAGIWIENASPHISDSLIQDHQGSGADQDDGLFLVSSSSPVIQNTHLRNNHVNIVSDDSSSYVDGGGNVME